MLRDLDIIYESKCEISLPDVKKILICGKGSYIGTKVKNYLDSKTNFLVTELDVSTSEWKKFDFSKYDVVYQVAGIAHKKEKKDNAHLYYEVNCDLAVSIATKAKKAGVKQYIYMSSMAVYGLEESHDLIGLNTPLKPNTHYGKSKLLAETNLSKLESENFIISYIRPPMVYGSGAPGNLERLYKFVRKIHIFPTIKNERSSISIDNICVGIEKVITEGYSGIVIMQDKKYHCTFDIVREEMIKENVRVKYIGIFNAAIKFFVGKMGLVSKVFGDLKYMRNEDIKKPKKILFLVNHSYTIYNTRKELVKKLLDEGYDVYISSPYGKSLDILIKWGCKYLNTDFDRHGRNPFEEIKLLRKYKNIIKRIEPDIILTYTIKPNIYGSIAAKKYKIPVLVNITGLGSAVENNGILQKIIVKVYKFAFKNVKTIYVQNTFNRQFFEQKGLYKEKLILLPGSGVNLEEFSVLEYPSDKKISFVFVSRVMKEKGIDQFLDAARYIKNKYKNTEFHICGFCEENYKLALEEEQKKGIIIYHDWVDDTKKILKNMQCSILPTYYPEGMSNVLLEACASGRAIITTNRPGCREIVDNGINGFVVPEKNSEKLIEAIEKFIQLSNDERMRMGLAGRKKVETEFNRQKVVDEYLKEISNNVR